MKNVVLIFIIGSPNHWLWVCKNLTRLEIYHIEGTLAVREFGDFAANIIGVRKFGESSLAQTKTCIAKLERNF